jgi:hypothetical protein
VTLRGRVIVVEDAADILLMDLISRTSIQGDLTNSYGFQSLAGSRLSANAFQKTTYEHRLGVGDRHIPRAVVEARGGLARAWRAKIPQALSV